MAGQTTLFAVLCAFLGISAAQLSPRISISHGCTSFTAPCALTLTEGMDTTVSFNLDEPIICATQSEECVVVVNISNSHPDIVSVDPCLVRWTQNTWHQTKTVRVTAVQSYQATHEEHRVHLETHVVSTSEYYRDFDPLDIYVMSENRRSAGCSANGDPHIHTFDGKYWHFYDGTSRNPSRVTLYRSTTRDFIIQNQLRGFPARNCAMAGREGPDRVVINSCGRNPQIITDFNSADPSKHPNITVSGRTYTVYFHSGAWMRAATYPGYVGVFVQSVDYRTSCGICGNFDGIAENDSPGRTVAWARANTYSALFPCQKVPSVVAGGATLGDIWEWTYNPADFPNNTAPTNPSAQETCPYEILRIILPELNPDDIDDITDAINDLADQIREQNGGGNFRWDNGTNDNVQITVYPRNLSIAACQAQVDASLAVNTCRQRYPQFAARIANYTADCAEDYSEMGGPSSPLAVTFLEGTVRAMRRDCLEIAIETGDANDATLRQALCMNACSGRGVCGVDARCTCNAGYGGVDCSVDLNAPPTIHAVSDLVYDTAGHQQPPLSPTEILVHGSNFLRSNGTRCRFGTNITTGLFVGPTSIICRVPTFGRDNIHRGAVPLAMNLSVSNNGQTWSPDSHQFQFLFFDSTCQRCDVLGNCTENPDTCTVGSGASAKCYLPDATDPALNNICLQCKPSISNSALSHTYSHRLCQPEFTSRIYQESIVRSANAGDVILTVNARANPLLANDPNYTIRYEYIQNNQDNLVRQMFNVNPTTGDITIIDAVDITQSPFNGLAHAAQNPRLFNGFFQVRATDPSNNAVTTQVNIELVPEGYAPIFPEDGFFGVVPENASVGSPVFNATNIMEALRVTASNLQQDNLDASEIRYNWQLEPGPYAGALAINYTTGEITVADPSKLDYEGTPVPLHFENSTLQYQVSATSITQSLLFAIVNVRISVTNVPEPPTAVFVGDTQDISIDENTAGFVGNLSTEDPEGGSFTYAIESATSPFVVVTRSDGSAYLNLTTALDYESGITVFLLTIRSTDSGGLSATSDITVRILNVNEKPHSISIVPQNQGLVLEGNTIIVSENTPLVTGLAQVTAVDPEGLAINCYVPNSYFKVAPADNCISQRDTASSDNSLIVYSRLDYESDANFSLMFVCIDCDGMQSDPQIFNVSVVDANEPPTIVNWVNHQQGPVVEGRQRNDRLRIGTVTVRDDAGSLSDPVIEPVDPAMFEVSAPLCTNTSGSPLMCTADVYLLATAVVSYEEFADTHGAGNYQILLQLTDGVDQPGSRESARGNVSMMVSDVPELPTSVELSQSTVTENPPVGFVIANITIIDEDVAGNNFTVELIANPGGAFAVSPATTRRRQQSGGTVWTLTVANSDAFDHETASNLVFTLNITDQSILSGPNSVQFTKSITVTDAPMNIVANSTQISGIPGLHGVRFSLSNMDRPGLAGSITWSLSGASGWGQLTTLSGEFTDLEVTSSVVGQEFRNVQISASIPNVLSQTVQFQLEFTDVQLPPIVQNPDDFIGISVPEFADSSQPVLASVVARDPASSMGQTMEIFVGRLLSDGSGRPNTHAVYLDVLGSYTNRFISSSEYIAQNPDEMTRALGPFYVERDPMYSRCNMVAADPAGDFTCDIRVLAQPALRPSSEAAGIVNATGLFNVNGLFVVVVNDGSGNPNPGVDMQLAAFAPLSVAYPGETTTVPTIFIGENSGEDDSSASTSVIVAVVIVILLLLLLVAAAFFYRQQKVNSARNLFDGKEAATENAAYEAMPVPYEETPFRAGVENPLYDWYQPKMSRKECTDYLMALGEGAFVVRDSDANPGWHMLGVKSANHVLHEKIRMTENGEYQLMPSVGAAAEVQQPCFTTVPLLIEHYLKEQPGMAFTLVASNPIYDNSRLAQERTGQLQKAEYDEALPGKHREYAQVDAYGAGANSEKHGGDSVGNPMYFSNVAAGGQPQTYAAPYLDVEPGAAASAAASTQGYLDIDPDADEEKPSAQGYQDLPGQYSTGVQNQETAYAEVPTNDVSMTEPSDI